MRPSSGSPPAQSCSSVSGSGASPTPDDPRLEKPAQAVVVRRARPDESDLIAALYRRTAERDWSFLVRHTPAEDRAFFRSRVFAECTVWAAEAEDAVIGFCAARRGWIGHLYVAHEHHGRGVGRALLERALKGRSHVRLWTFQCNERARRFYRRNGFVEALFTDGAHNEESEPDVRLEWQAERIESTLPLTAIASPKT